MVLRLSSQDSIPTLSQVSEVVSLVGVPTRSRISPVPSAAPLAEVAVDVPSQIYLTNYLALLVEELGVATPAHPKAPTSRLPSPLISWMHVMERRVKLTFTPLSIVRHAPEVV
jgi:hypothetical protein